MNPIYNSSVISFINTATQEPMIHPEGDYSQLNLKIKRLEYLIEKHQPEQPIVFSYQPPVEDKEIIHSDNKQEVSEKEKIMDKIFSLRVTSCSNLHFFTIPAIGSNPPMTQITPIENFNDFNTHLSQLDNLLNEVTARIENEYDEHPLHYNKKVEFRKASYIDHGQAFSYLPVEKPFGEYPLTKPFFDKAIKELNLIGDNYHIFIDFVTDWEDQYSSFDGSPKSYGIEITVFFDDKQLSTIKTSMNHEQLNSCKDNHDFLDANLAPMFEKLSMNVSKWYEAMKNNKKPKI
jgi:hypothetical protein